MPSFLPHRVSPPNKLVVLNQTCLDLPTTSSEGRKWRDDEEEEVADNVESSSGLQKGKAPIESQIADDMTESIEGRKWGDDEEEEVADNVESSIGLQKGKAPIESQIADDMTESTEDKIYIHKLALRRSKSKE
ncbi:hypothetical protein K7X08_021812 [Anisodus acutangulus]|uniref:Uncharacterized protein n=1 Tax=Anisodus acutangulus TaxID=402998 RepID=A0A9Q1QV06_9SOLA|nr:hypothetical protein K7X08_021812 [Anisodus acutangulus]